MLFDIRHLAYQAFQGCRHSWAGTDGILALLVPMLDDAWEKGVLALEVPESHIDELGPAERAHIEEVQNSQARVDQFQGSKGHTFRASQRVTSGYSRCVASRRLI